MFERFGLVLEVPGAQIWQMEERRLQTIGVDGDQVMAAVNATLKMLNLLMLQNQVQAESAA